MFSARCCQKAKNRYPNTNIVTAIIAMYITKSFIELRVDEIFYPGPNAVVTSPITREIEGRRSPASTDPAVPSTIYKFSLEVL